MSQGLIDIHFHGQAGYDVMSGNPEDLQGLSLHLKKQGVAGFLATFVSSPKEEVLAALETVKKVQGSEKGAKILGVHLEGPFLHPERKGAHNPVNLRPPDLAEIKEWIAAGEGIVKLVTIAPELPGADAAVRFLVKKGVRVSMGHTTATFEQAAAAKKLGVKSVTHLFNAMNPVHHRSPGLPGFALIDDDLYTEIIADGVHVSDDIVRLVLRCRPKRKIILISDGLFLTKRRDLGDITLGGLKVSMSADGSLRLPDGTLAGSNSTIKEIVDRVVGLGALPRADVIRMASTNPLEMLGLR
ncbi:MAG: N-acetylglucosamine-6-phosphate deacetylase [Planctomycetes bacterium]|nr:N-acetylglucosamine-6-phosphate deacetylase [Planctomycetota bacterium]